MLHIIAHVSSPPRRHQSCFRYPALTISAPGVSKTLSVYDNIKRDVDVNKIEQSLVQDNADPQSVQNPTKEDGDSWPMERIIYRKYGWECLPGSSDIQVLSEHEIYVIPHVPKQVVGANVQSGKTKTQEMADARASPRQHYRLVLGVVGHALTTFRCTKELVTGVLDAMKGALTPGYL